MSVVTMSVTTDHEEYSRYTASLRTIVVTASVSSGTLNVGETFTVTIRRPVTYNWPEAYSAIMTKNVVATQQHVTTNSISTSFVLGEDDVDEHIVARMISGKYIVRVTKTSNDNFWESASQISVTLLPTSEIRNEWCYGVPLRASEILGMKFPPKLITGLVIDEISPEVTPGIKKFSLTYVATPVPTWTLRMDAGTPITITGLTSSQHLLMDENNVDYCVVTINPLRLPTAAVTESLLVTQMSMTDEMLQNRIQAAVDSVESMLGFYVQPYIVTTMPKKQGQPEKEVAVQDHWDKIGRSVDFIPTWPMDKWPSLRLPYQWCLRVDDLYGFHSTNKIIKVDRTWFEITVDRMSGLVSLVPSLGSIVQWTVYTHPMLVPFFLPYSVPAFWQYTGTFGLPDLSQGERAPVRELIARMAAASILIEAQRGYQGGIGSESTGRDGLSNSRSFNPGGPYASTIQQHQQWVQSEGPKIKARLGGLMMQMIGA